MSVRLFERWGYHHIANFHGRGAESDRCGALEGDGDIAQGRGVGVEVDAEFIARGAEDGADFQVDAGSGDVAEWGFEG